MSTDLVKDHHFHQDICDIQDNSLIPCAFNACYFAAYICPHVDAVQHGVLTLKNPQAQGANRIQALRLLIQIVISFCNCVVYAISVPFNIIFFGIKLAVLHVVPILEFVSFIDTVVAFFAIFSSAVSIIFESHSLYQIHHFRNQYHIQELCDLDQVVRDPCHPKRDQILQKSVELLAQLREEGLLQELNDGEHDTLHCTCLQKKDSADASVESMKLSPSPNAKELRDVLLRSVYEQLRKKYGPSALSHDRLEITSLLYETSAKHLEDVLKEPWEKGKEEEAHLSSFANEELERHSCMELREVTQSKADIANSFMKMVEEINIQTKRKRAFHVAGIVFSACVILFSVFFICAGPIMWLWILAFLSLALISIIKHTYFRNLLLSPGAPHSISMFIPPFFVSCFSTLFALAKRASAKISSKVTQWVHIPDMLPTRRRQQQMSRCLS